MDNQNQRVTEQAERGQFEAWARSGPTTTLSHVFSFTPHPNGGRYLDGDTELCWRAWQASRARPAAQDAPVATVIKHGAERQWMSENLGSLPDGTYSLYLSQQAAPEAPTAWLATDLDGRGDVAFTKEEAKRRAGEGCTEFFPLYDSAPATQQAGAAVDPDDASYAWMAAEQRKGRTVSNAMREAYAEGLRASPAATTASASTDEIVTCAKCGWRVNSADYCSVSNCPTSRAPAPSQEAAPLARYSFDASGVPERDDKHGEYVRFADLAQQGAAQAAHAGADTERDAARYRYLRHKREPIPMSWTLDIPDGAALDDALDSLIAASQPQKGSK
jgi:hypothetical protein